MLLLCNLYSSADFFLLYALSSFLSSVGIVMYVYIANSSDNSSIAIILLFQIQFNLLILPELFLLLMYLMASCSHNIYLDQRLLFSLILKHGRLCGYTCSCKESDHESARPYCCWCCRGSFHNLKFSCYHINLKSICDVIGFIFYFFIYIYIYVYNREQPWRHWSICRKFYPTECNISQP